jgi:hypothetical protein
LVNEKVEPGKTFNLAYAVILQTNAATLAILFDRFSQAQLVRIEKVLRRIGAAETLADYLALKSAFDELVERGMSRLDASDVFDQPDDLRLIARKSSAHVSEMEERLLAFANAHLDELAAAQPTVSPELARYIRNVLASAERVATRHK